MGSDQSVTPERRAEVSGIVAAVTEWARRRSDVRGVALVGSWAHGSATMLSDVDVVILTPNTSAYVDDDGWLEFMGPVALVRAERWGALTERRVRLASGLDIEFGITEPSWAGTDPVDPGTFAVIRGGFEILFDPDQRLRSLLEATEARAEHSRSDHPDPEQ